MITAAEMKNIVNDISKRDKQLKKIIDSQPLCSIGRTIQPISNYEALIKSIISQQLAVNAAASIFQRVRGLVGGSITPAKLNSISESDLRTAGVSVAKYKTIHGLTDSVIKRKLNVEGFNPLTEEQLIIHALTSLWGIGPWTVHMFLIFQLGKLDVWPIGDLGVKKGWEKIYSPDKRIELDELNKKGDIFRPYRSVVAWYCWRALD